MISTICGLCKNCRSLNFWFSRLRGAQVWLRARRAGRSRRLNWFAVLCVILRLCRGSKVLGFSITFGFCKKCRDQNLLFFGEFESESFLSETSWCAVSLKVKVFYLRPFGAR